MLVKIVSAPTSGVKNFMARATPAFAVPARSNPYRGVLLLIPTYPLPASITIFEVAPSEPVIVNAPAFAGLPDGGG